MAETTKETTKEKKDVLIHLIPAEWDNAEFILVGINGKRYQVNTGVDVEVPWYIAESIRNSKADAIEAVKRAKNGGKKK